MKQERPASHSALAALPLVMAYGIVPLVTAVKVFMPSAHAISMFMPWVLLAGLGTIHAMLFRRSGERLKQRFFFEVAMFGVLIFMLIQNHAHLIRQFETLFPIIIELTPVAVLAFCGAWSLTFGVPDRTDFQRYGGVLGGLCLLDLVIEGLLFHNAPVVRFIGNVDVLAGLLLLSLCASLKTDARPGDPITPDQKNRVWRLLILVGIAATLSRTGLFAAGWIVLCFGRGSKTVRTLIFLAFFSLIGGTFLLPISASEAVRYVDYWLWAKSIALFTAQPVVLLTGLPFGDALPLTFPAGMDGIWEAATGRLAIMGAYLPQVSAFWLRFTLGWGLIPPVLCLIAILALLYRTMTRLGAGLLVVLLTQGMVAPLFYAPSLGIAVGFALLLALSNTAPKSNTRIVSSVESSPDPDRHDPVAEWDLRPL
ncbi:hypothetical protein GO013_02250 [Pseudodesulfovibrio sp. JC047]|uniref:hypothetical protein n=1 Tax=Pseudodesulfovibrio sp. JC047 TaxID=2683199 RepID=UPI0013D59180|nr:hypothetical protein [Pseudodesulfovibrio sp. JC047]NDV18240.1 hypothetical protein [Pseudodesulfovibrio sp. JC047]